jgi:hypothetical protein
MAYHAWTATAGVVTRQKGIYFTHSAAPSSATEAKAKEAKAPHSVGVNCCGLQGHGRYRNSIILHQAALRRCARPRQRYRGGDQIRRSERVILHDLSPHRVVRNGH